MKKLISGVLILIICGMAEVSFAVPATSTSAVNSTEMMVGKGKKKRNKAGKRKKNGRYKKKRGLFGRKKNDCGCPKN